MIAISMRADGSGMAATTFVVGGFGVKSGFEMLKAAQESGTSVMEEAPNEELVQLVGKV